MLLVRFGSAEMLGWLVYEYGIDPHVTVFDKSVRIDGAVSRDDFTDDNGTMSITAPAAQRSLRRARS
jgi:hypothetical protein